MKKLALIASVLVATTATVYGVVSAPIPFVQAWWHAADYDRNDGFHKRHRMADWLVLTKVLIGLRRDEVLAKLGPPPPTDKFTEYDLVYNLGFERGILSIDSEWLVMRFSHSGVVAEASVVRD